MKGDHHDIIGIGTAAFAGAICAAWYPVSGAVLAASTVATTLYLSPDLDCRGSYRCKAWWRWRRYGLGWYWRAYAATIPHHRHWLSHSIGVGTAYRLLWLLWPALPWIWQAPVDLGLVAVAIAGAVLADAVHLWCDRAL